MRDFRVTVPVELARCRCRSRSGIERFPNRSNVSFVRVLDPHTIEAVFYERGAGETRSSGTGSTGAAAAAILRGVTSSPSRFEPPLVLCISAGTTVFISRGPPNSSVKAVTSLNL